MKTWLEDNENILVLDIRPKEQREEWQIPGSIYLNAYERLNENDLTVLDEISIPENATVITVCGAGKTSNIAADGLSGMLLQGIILIGLIFGQSFAHYIFLSSLLGVGTALVYPTFLATVAENTNPEDRAHSLGIFRFWRDMGYAIGAVLTGIIADFISVSASILVVGLLTISSALIIIFRMNCKGNI